MACKRLQTIMESSLSFYPAWPMIWCWYEYSPKTPYWDQLQSLHMFLAISKPDYCKEVRSILLFSSLGYEVLKENMFFSAGYSMGSSCWDTAWMGWQTSRSICTHPGSKVNLPAMWSKPWWFFYRDCIQRAETQFSPLPRPWIRYRFLSADLPAYSGQVLKHIP